ncbi:class I tRNA ligase family protein, partial [Staphylococcus epidermidis]|uniref:class I tRNA ligase family protein n=1 Tax=Staphylococcus epidermidis TaxID=1282 RepID=UPI0011A0E58B
AVTHLLKQKRALLKLHFITHTYPHHSPTKKPLIFTPTPQSFPSINKLTHHILHPIQHTNFKLHWAKTRIYNI